MFIPICLIILILIFIPPKIEGQKFSSPILQQVTKPVDHGEGPFWDYRKNLLYFVDIHSGDVYSFDYDSGDVCSIHLNGDVTPVLTSKNDPNILIVGLNRSVVAVEWDGKKQLGSNKILTTVSQQYPTSRFNDGKADKQGRLWFGTMGFEDNSGVTPNEGVLYKITKDNLSYPSVIIAPVNISNGMAWNKNNDKFYYIDTPTRKVVEYVWDETCGTISNPRVAFDMTDYDSVITGFPDGMTIDTDDNLWIALYNGGSVIKVNPESGKLLQIVAIPASAVTSVAWGGPDLDILFVTTSRYRLSENDRKMQPAAGSLFAISNLNTNGFLPFEANVIDFI